MRKKTKIVSGTSRENFFEENEKMIKRLTIFLVIYSIIYLGLIIAWIYCKIKGL